jgi:hypothetical protein
VNSEQKGPRSPPVTRDAHKMARTGKTRHTKAAFVKQTGRLLNQVATRNALSRLQMAPMTSSRCCAYYSRDTKAIFMGGKHQKRHQKVKGSLEKGCVNRITDVKLFLSMFSGNGRHFILLSYFYCTGSPL